MRYNISRYKKGVDFMASTTITMRIDEETKTQLQDLTAKLGRKIEKEEAFASMERIVDNKVLLDSNMDYDAELASYRNEKY
jgi:hypothetical protein